MATGENTVHAREVRRARGAASPRGDRTTPTPNGTLYAAHFTDDELDRIIARLTDPAARLDSAIEATYVLLDRVIGQISARGAQRDEEDQDNPDAFVKLVRAHNETTGRIATLLRSRQVIRGEGTDTLTGHIAAALDQLADQLRVDL